MKIEKIDVSALVNKASALLKNEQMSFPMRTTIKLLLKVITALIKQKTLNSRNSSIPPSKDPNRPKDSNDRDTLPPGAYKAAGVEKRQVFVCQEVIGGNEYDMLI